MLELNAEEKALVVSYMYTRCGIDLSDKDYLIASKVSVECFKLRINTFHEFWLRLSGTGAEAVALQQRLIDVLTTSYSYFYREEDHFKVLAKLVENGEIPKPGQPLRGWCAGCAGGQEAYTLAMTLTTAVNTGSLQAPFRITASDVSTRALEQARKGHYPMADYVRLPESWRKAFCFIVPGGCEIRKSIRDVINFKQENLLHPSEEEQGFDFIFCRNVLIYFNKESIKQVINVFWHALNPGGYLFLGHTEIFNELDGFSYLHPAVYQKVRDTDGI